MEKQWVIQYIYIYIHIYITKSRFITLTLNETPQGGRMHDSQDEGFCWVPVHESVSAWKLKQRWGDTVVFGEWCCFQRRTVTEFSCASWDLSALMAWHHSVPSKQLRAREQALCTFANGNSSFQKLCLRISTRFSACHGLPIPE